jgi:hypothetical protein
MERKLIIATAITAAVILAAGCVNYNQVLVLNDDGSGTVTVRYTSDDPKGVSGAPVLPFTEEEIVAVYKGSNLVVHDIVPDRESENYAGVTYQIDFDNVTDLNGYGIFAVGDKLTQTFYLSDLGDTMSFTQTTILTVDVEDDFLLEAYEFNYKLVCPGDVIENNGDFSYGDFIINEDGVSNGYSTVGWSYTLPELINNPVKMYAVYSESGKTGNGLGSIGPGKVSD